MLFSHHFNLPDNNTKPWYTMFPPSSQAEQNTIALTAFPSLGTKRNSVWFKTTIGNPPSRSNINQLERKQK